MRPCTDDLWRDIRNLIAGERITVLYHAEYKPARQGDKYILCVPDNKKAEKLQGSLYEICKNYPVEKLPTTEDEIKHYCLCHKYETEPYRLGVKVIEPQGPISLKISTIPKTSIGKQDKIIKTIKEFYDKKIEIPSIEIDSLKWKREHLALNQDERMNIEQKIFFYEQKIVNLNNNKDKDINYLQQHLQSEKWYKFTYYRDDANSYRITYYDKKKSRRVQTGCGPIVICIGDVELISKNGYMRKNRTDRIANSKEYQKPPCSKLYIVEVPLSSVPKKYIEDYQIRSK